MMYLKQTLRFDDIWTVSPGMKQCLRTAARVAPLDMDVLIVGETGTGKNLLAQAIHNVSPRTKGPFLEFNTASIPHALAENELFGHEAGAFTGATTPRRGVFEQASGGTLFLDEIGNMSPEVQAKVLSAVERKRIRRLGGEDEVDCDVRLICATNTDVEAAVEAGTLREDLCYRLARCVLRVPSLRERLDDIPLLVERFIALDNTSYNRAVTGVSQACMARLLDYPWPGNVRQLRAKISFAVAICEGSQLEPVHVFPETAGQTDEAATGVGEGLTLAACLAAAERGQIAKVLTMAGWNITKAASLLGITRTTLRDRIKTYDLQRPSD
jgi:transcriptional regulator with PAS, ATPase and Fis domain